MFPFSQGWMKVSAFGYGMFFAMALRGAAQMIGWLSGAELSERAGGNIFLIGTLIFGPIGVWLYSRSLKARDAEGASASGVGART